MMLYKISFKLKSLSNFSGIRQIPVYGWTMLQRWRFNISLSFPSIASSMSNLHLPLQLQNTTTFGWWFRIVVASLVAWTKLLYTEPSYYWVGDHLWVGKPPRYVTTPTSSTQPCIPPRSQNQVPALICWLKAGMSPLRGWQVTLCNLIWNVSSHSGAASCKLLYPVTLLYFWLMLNSVASVNNLLRAILWQPSSCKKN